MGKTNDSITALTSLLDFSPTDSEAWAELADMYLSQGLYGQAIYALEEVLVLMPNAWNVCTANPFTMDPHLTSTDACEVRRGAVDGCGFWK